MDGALASASALGLSDPQHSETPPLSNEDLPPLPQWSPSPSASGETMETGDGVLYAEDSDAQLRSTAELDRVDDDEQPRRSPAVLGLVLTIAATVIGAIAFLQPSADPPGSADAVRSRSSAEEAKSAEAQTAPHPASPAPIVEDPPVEAPTVEDPPVEAPTAEPSVLPVPGTDAKHAPSPPLPAATDTRPETAALPRTTEEKRRSRRRRKRRRKRRSPKSAPPLAETETETQAETQTEEAPSRTEPELPGLLEEAPPNETQSPQPSPALDDGELADAPAPLPAADDPDDPDTSEPTPDQDEPGLDDRPEQSPRQSDPDPAEASQPPPAPGDPERAEP